MNEKRLLASLTVLAALTCAPVVHAARPIRAMILDGESRGPYHEWRQTTPYLKRMLEETGLFAVDVVTAPPSPAQGLSGRGRTLLPRTAQGLARRRPLGAVPSIPASRRAGGLIHAARALAGACPR